MKKAIILLSGGLDSATVLSIAKSKNHECYAMSFNYGQRHTIELERAKKLAKEANVKEHLIIDINLGIIGGSALTTNIEVPKYNNVDEINRDIPITYVPGRNTIFLSFALSYAEVIEAQLIYIGVNALDYSGYPDCRPNYIKAYEVMANEGTKLGLSGKKIKIETPLLFMTKGEIIKQGLALKTDYSSTITCYDPIGELSCGKCDSCLLRLKGFKEAGVKDPIKYAINIE